MASTQDQNKFIDPTGRMAESTLRIQDLAQVEKVCWQITDDLAKQLTCLLLQTETSITH